MISSPSLRPLRTPAALLGLFLAFAPPAPKANAISVSISSPADAATVSGQIDVTGTSADLGGGRVSVSIDGGPFTLAQGTTNWTWAWDTTTVGDGPHTITARARMSQQDPNPVFDSVNVTVDNTPTGLSVTITNPTEGQEISTTLVVTGTSNLATAVSLQIDGGAFQVANGTDPWDFIIEEGALAPGAHTLTARAEDGAGGEAFDTVNITATTLTTGLQDFTYLSSVDGVSMNSKLYVPTSYNPAGPGAGLVVHLHGGGGVGNINPTHQSELDARGWIGIAPDGRAWGLASQGCTWNTSAAYVDSFDPDVGPGEQDIFDAIQFAIDNYNIDSDRIYLTGFSMGGRGTYIIGLKNPDYFAAIGPTGPAIDMYEIFERRPEPAACKEGMTGGQPGDSLLVDTIYRITSGRFLIENAHNLPVFHGHGTIDNVANNNPANAPFLHGSHILNDTSWNACHGDPLLGLCFGHTPTLSELKTLHPSGYDWAYMFTPVAHTQDSLWLQGAPTGGGNLGVEDPGNPGNLIGMYQFFDTRTRVASPDIVVFKSYTDTHRKAYWTDILIDQPWMDVPGAIRAARNVPSNQIDAELVRVHHATFDLDLAGLTLSAAQDLTITLDVLDEPVFDPALAPGTDILTPTVTVTGDFTGLTWVTVLRDGTPVPAQEVAWTTTGVTVGPLAPITDLTTLTFSTQEFPLIPVEPTPADCAAFTPGTALPFLNAIAAATLDFPSASTIELWIIGHSENRGYHPFLQTLLDNNPIGGKTFVVRNDWIGGHETWRWATPGQAGYQKIEDHLPELTHPTIALILTSNNAGFPIGMPTHDDANFVKFIDDCESVADHLYDNGNGVAMCYFSSHRYKVSNVLPSYYEKHAVASLVERAEQSGKDYIKAGPEQHDLHWCFWPEYFAVDQTHTNALGDQLMADTWYHFLGGELAPAGFSGDPFADDDRDGVLALVEYGLGTGDDDPSAGRPQMQSGIQNLDVGGAFDDYFTFTFQEDLNATDVGMAVQLSTDMQTWNGGPGFVEFVSSADNGDGTATVTYRTAGPVTGDTRIFLRLVVTLS